MKTTLDGVVFLLPHVSGHAKNGVSPQADFPRTERRARKRHAPFGRVGRAAGGGRQGGRTARWQGSGRQATRQRAARRRAARRRAARRQSSRTAKWQGGKVAGRQSGRAARRQSGRTAKWQDGKVAGRQSGRAARWQDGGRQDGRKRGDCDFFLKKIKNHFVRKSYVPASRRQGRVIAADKSGAPPAQPPKNGRDNNVPPVLAPGFQPPGAAGQQKSARRGGPTPAKRRNAQALNTLFGHREGCNIIRTAAVTKITESNFSIFLHSDHSFQAHSRPLPWSFPFPELCPEAERVSVSANLRRHRAAFDLRFSILCTISHKILFYDVFTGFSRHAPTHVYGAARIHGAAPQ